MAIPFPDPAAAPQPLAVRQAAPAGRGLRRTVLRAIAIAIGLVLCLVFILMNRPRSVPIAKRSADAAPQLGYVTDAMRALPDSYAKLTQAAPKEPPPLPEEPPERMMPPAQTVPARPAELSDREKAARKAREADIEVNEPKQKTGPAAPPVALAPSQGPEDMRNEHRSISSDKETWREQHARLKETEVSDRLHAPPSPYALMAGTWMPLNLESGIHSQLPGHIKGRVRQNVYDTTTGRYLLVPQGTVLIGEYNSQVIYGEDRILAVWTRLVFPNGTSIQLEGMDAVSVGGTTGVKDQVDNHLWKLFGAVLMSSVLSTGARIPFGTPGNNQYHQNLPQEFAQQFGESANQAGQSIVRRQLSVPPTIKIRRGFAANAFVHRDLVFPGPYQWGVATARGGLRHDQ